MIWGNLFSSAIDGDDDDVIFAFMFFVFCLVFIILGVCHAYLSFGWIGSSVALFLLTEIVYHLEPRSSYDKRSGRGYVKVAAKKIDSLIDAMLIVALITGGYRLVKLFNLASVISVLLKIGWVVLIILGIVGLIFGYLWLNRLRDLPSKKESDGKAIPSTFSKKKVKK